MGNNAALALRIDQLRRTYPSREDYIAHWRSQPHFPPADWNRWVEVFLNHEIGGEGPVRPKASEVAVLADIAAAIESDAIMERLRSVRVPIAMIRAESGFTPGQPPLYPDELAARIRDCVPHIEDHKVAGTTHYTMVLGENGAARIADLISELTERIGGRQAPR